MKKIVILGSTGSIGTNTLDVVSKFPERFHVLGLAAGSNVDIMAEQIKKYKPEYVSMFDPSAASKLEELCSSTKTELCTGLEGLLKIATLEDADIVMSAIVGAAGLIPTMAAIKAGKNIALANKETMVMAGKLVREEAFKKNVKIIPIDSEHNAIFQVLSNNKRHDVKNIILTASGGPLIDATESVKKHISPEEVMKHPTYKMGAKISVDSASLMNKGFEMIEAKWLFDIHPENISVIIHRQSIIHSLVEFIDGSVIGVLGNPDMRVPISYGLNYPDRMPLNLPALDLAKIGSLTFEEPDFDAFPCLGYAYDAVRTGGTMPAVLNGSNEEAVRLFLSGAITFPDIPKLIKKTMDAHTPAEIKTLEDVLIADSWGREHTLKFSKTLT